MYTSTVAHTHTHKCTHARTHMHTHTRTHTHTHTHTLNHELNLTNVYQFTFLWVHQTLVGDHQSPLMTVKRLK